MTVFVVLTKADSALTVKAAVERIYPTDNFELMSGHWLIADSGTAREVFIRLVGGTTVEEATKLGSHLLITGVSGYWGLWSSNAWEWIAAKMTESPKHGT